MKYWRAYLHYYRSQFLVGLAFFLLIWAFFNIVWAVLFYLLLGGLIGFIGFRSFYPNQLYFYYNLGITNWKLIERSSLLNILVTLFVAVLVSLFFLLIQ